MHYRSPQTCRRLGPLGRSEAAPDNLYRHQQKSNEPEE